MQSWRMVIMYLQARMRAHDWVSKVEQPVTVETAGRETQDHPGGEAAPGENEIEAKEKRGEEQGEEVKGGEEEMKEKEADHVEVRSTQKSYVIFVFNVLI